MSTKIVEGEEALCSARDVLLDDSKRIVSDADGLSGELSTSAVEAFASARHQFESKIGEARSKIDAGRIHATRQACAVADATNMYIREHPGKLIGLASLAGLLAAFLLFRRATK